MKLGRAAMLAAMLCGVGFTGTGLAAETTAPDPLAAMFGARENVIDISLSPDGEHIAHVTPGPGHSAIVTVIDVATGESHRIGSADGEPIRVSSCGWSSNTRIVCKFYGISRLSGQQISFSRTMGFDITGKNPLYLGRRSGSNGMRPNQFDGDVIDWRGGDGSVLMTRDWIAQEQTGGIGRSSRDGLGVELVDTMTGKGTIVEPPAMTASDYIADGQGNVRIKTVRERNDDGLLTGRTIFSYRTAGSRDWKPFSKIVNGIGLQPIAVDGTRDVAFAVQTLDGRDALYSVALDGSMKPTLVSSNPEVDVHSVVSIGRHGRIIGAAFTTDRRQVDYFDPDYKKLAASLARALPKTPIIQFVGADADEKKLLVYAASDVDPGHYYVFTKANRHLEEIVLARPELKDRPLTEMKHVRFAAADGTSIPAYLTLPPGGAKKGLPAIVLPHGGPASRDDWGFDWLVQYFAQAGYAVLQPQYRGSTGYGDAWFAQNGFRSWQLAIGDVLDAGRWLVKDGIADPAKLAIVGWSYGGYAALQANVIDPALFKAAVAVAPVTDLGMTKQEAVGFTNERLVAEQIGSGANVGMGSPARHADRIVAPVLMFHGDQDLNVGIAQSKAMDSALRRAGKKSTLVVFPKLDHQLDDNDARTKMLDQANRFLKASMGM